MGVKEEIMMVDQEREVMKSEQGMGRVCFKGGPLHMRTVPYTAMQHMYIDYIVTYGRRTLG